MRRQTLKWICLTIWLLAAIAPAPAARTRTRKKVKAAAAVAAVPLDTASAAGLISIGQKQLDTGNAEGAIRYAEAAAGKKSPLDDYAHWIRAQAEYKQRNYEEVSRSVTRVFHQAPLSPFVGPGAALAVHALLDSDHPKESLDMVRKYYDQIPRPQGDLLLAQCLQATGDLPQAAEYFQRVYYGYPAAKEATDAANALVELKQKLNDGLPPPMPSTLLDRAQKLFAAKNPSAARIELAAAILQIGGAERDVARVRLGVADYQSNNPSAAFEYLSALKVDDAEADAERLSYLIRCARKLDKHADVKLFLEQLEKNHPASPWRLDALIFVADQGRVDNDTALFHTLYQSCATSFPTDKRASWCHWQVAFASYREDKNDTADLLRTFLKQFGDADTAENALYFLGRSYDRGGQYAAAKACYEQMLAHFPNTYYAVEARQRLTSPAIQAALADPATLSFLAGVPWVSPPQLPSFVPGKLAAARLQRSRLLQLAGLQDLAENELKFGAVNDGEQQNVYSFELAKMAEARDEPEQAMRYVRLYTPGYLYVPLDQAPAEFWELAFPIPYRAAIEQYSSAQGLDPFFVAALIRQESGFNPRIISHANAYGLMQLLPSTGRGLARQVGIRRFSANQLLTADRNIQLGTYMFRNLLNSYNGQAEVALASYNAGPGRATLWQQWGPFREPAEFIETVPFHETRIYVQIVMRNADVYKRLYAGKTPNLPQYHPKPAPKTTPKVTRKRHKIRSRHK